MPLDDLRLFIRIVQLGNIAQAASESGVTQPAASQRLRHLEKRLGFDLFDRSFRPMALTERGEVYYQGCLDIDQIYSRMEDRLNDQDNGFKTTLNIYAIYSSGIEWLNRLRPEFEASYPEIKLTQSFLRPDQIHQAVLNKETEVGLVSYPDQWPSVVAHPLRNETMGIVTRPDHILAKYWQIEPTDLEGQRFVFFDDNLPISRHVMRYLKGQQIHPNVSQTFDNVDSIKAYLIHTQDVAILPLNTVQAEEEAGLLKSAKLSPKLTRPVGIIHNELSEAGKLLLEFLKTHANLSD